MLSIFLSHAKKSLLLLIWAAGSTSPCFALADTAQDSSVIAALVLNFARFTEWPAGAIKENEPVRLCVLGDNVVQDSFDDVDERQVADKILKVIKMARVKNVEQCHLLYVSGLDRSTIIQLLSDASKQHVLAIGGDDEHFLKDGGMVALRIVEGKVNIQINLNAVKRAGLQISSRVLKLASIVNY